MAALLFAVLCAVGVEIGRAVKAHGDVIVTVSVAVAAVALYVGGYIA